MANVEPIGSPYCRVNTPTVNELPPRVSFKS